MKRKHYIFAVLVLILIFIVSGCSNTQNSADSKADITIEQVNDFLNNSAGLGPNGIGNVVSVIPHAHIDGPKNETPFYAFVNFKYRARDYIKYQVSYLSCTCREASVNMWQTMYVELTLPESKNPEDVKVKFLSFDKDSTGHYNGGHWGDSDPVPAGVTYELFMTEYIPFFPQKDSKYIHSLSTIDDIKVEEYQEGEGRDGYTTDALSGATVSANNIIRILNSIMDYHAADEFFNN